MNMFNQSLNKQNQAYKVMKQIDILELNKLFVIYKKTNYSIFSIIFNFLINSIRLKCEHYRRIKCSMKMIRRLFWD